MVKLTLSRMKKLFLILFMATSYHSYAYQCEAPFRKVNEEFLAAGATFTGKAIHIGAKNESGRIPVRFSVDTVYRYKKEPRKAAKLEYSVDFNTLDNGDYDCTKIEINRSYLVYAFPEGKSLITDVCTRGVLNRKCNRTRSLENAKEDLEFLGTSRN